MKYLIAIFFLQSLFILDAQENKIDLKNDPLKGYVYEDDLLTKEFHKNRRDALRKLMPENSVAVFFTNPIRNRSNDVDYEYHQDPNFYYLSGYREPHGVLLIFKETQNFDSIQTNEILIVQEKDPSSEIWTGKRLGKKGAETLLGFELVFNNTEFKDLAFDLKSFNVILAFPNESDERDFQNETADLHDLKKHFYNTIKLQNASKKLDVKNLDKLMSKLRQVKLNEELILLKKAIDITCEAQIELMKALNPEMKEYQTEALVEYVFKKNGAEYPGFPSIQGSGENSCVLHYTTNRKPLKGNELLVSDIGAEYHGYTADVTRTLPTDGKFSEEEKIIYNIVLEAQNAGINKCKPGNKFWDPHLAATNVIAKRLLELGIIKNEYQVQKYFMHGTSHYLGLDVHDAGLYGILEIGNVITVEPGIYIPEGSDCDPKWWNIGVRIEDDILITDNEPVNLSEKAPRTIEEIEKMMQMESFFK
jgi:Xaa-Pro aminopeptidase